MTLVRRICWLVQKKNRSKPFARSKADVDVALVEMGKVSDTQGGWFGNKGDSGAGLVWT